MARFHQFLEKALRDQCITTDEVDVIRQQIEQDGQLNLKDVKLLVELRSNARQVCEEFDELFFPILKQVMLQDGRLGQDESFYLLKLLYGNRQVQQREKQFLRELWSEAQQVSPEFKTLCEEALR